jgi:hypothetical protein
VFLGGGGGGDCDNLDGDDDDDDDDSGPRLTGLACKRPNSTLNNDFLCLFYCQVADLDDEEEGGMILTASEWTLVLGEECPVAAAWLVKVNPNTHTLNQSQELGQDIAPNPKISSLDLKF